MIKRYAINSEFVFKDCLVTPSVYEGVLQRLYEFIAPLISHLHARSQQHKASDYMRGLLSDTERKNIESISYFYGEDRQRLQKFIGHTIWNDELILDKLAKQIANEIGEEDGILILDPTSFPKKGKESVGVQRQWCGRLGKNENCQVAIFLAYASHVEFALVDRRLFLPDVWIENQQFWSAFLTMELLNQKKNVPMMTLQQVRECIGGMLLKKRLKACDQK